MGGGGDGGGREGGTFPLTWCPVTASTPSTDRSKLFTMEGVWMVRMPAQEVSAHTTTRTACLLDNSVDGERAHLGRNVAQACHHSHTPRARSQILMERSVPVDTSWRLSGERHTPNTLPEWPTRDVCSRQHRRGTVHATRCVSSYLFIGGWRKGGGKVCPLAAGARVNHCRCTTG